MFYSFNSDCVALNKKILFHKQSLLMSTEELESCITSGMVNFS